MNLYSLALFLHVSGAIGTFVSLGIWLFGLAALRRARLVEQVRALAWLIIVASPLMVLSVLLLALAGLEMALSAWGLSTPWIAVSLVSVVLIGPIGAFVLDPRMRTILALMRETPDGPLADAHILRTHDPVLVRAVSTLATMLLGIVFLMTTKPQLVTSWLVMGITVFVGLIVSLLFRSPTLRQASFASAQVINKEDDPFLRKTIWTGRW
jgi:predicted integral membrane protein DUF2269